MTRINILDDSTINKIAAGEVIERPSSIIKEIVENSLDAGAKNITIQIENAGKDMIKVIDDGAGIEADDINKAFLRHATSKIRRAEDLSNLHSLGFRGGGFGIYSCRIQGRHGNEDRGCPYGYKNTYKWWQNRI